MISTNYIYNNEAIGAISIASVLRHCKKMSYAKSLLILPFFSHKETTRYLKNGNTKIDTLEEFLVKKIECFSNFEERYYSLIPVSINSIFILKELSIIDIREGFLTYVDNNSFDFEHKDLGKRAKDIIKGSEKLSILLKEDADKLYLQLRIKL